MRPVYRIEHALAIFAIAILHLTGCATSTPLREANLPRDDWPIRVDATQNEIRTETSSTNAMAAGGGLLGVLIVHAIDSSRNSKAQEAVVSIRDLLIDYPLMEQFVSRLEVSNVPIQLTGSGEVIVTRRAEETESHPESIDIVPRVLLANDLSALIVQLQFSEFARSEEGEPEETGVHQLYEFLWPIEEPSAGNDRQDYAESWLAYGKDNLIGLIERGMSDTIKMFDQHLSRPTLALSQTRHEIPNYGDYTPRLKVWKDHGDVLWLAEDSDAHIVYAVRKSFVD